jgi:hypothetical protein
MICYAACIRLACNGIRQGNIMNYLSALLLSLIATTSSAAPLCDAACKFILTFPDGGSIGAVEPLSFSFGNGGYINDGVVTTGFADGETMSLGAGESLTFTAGGSLDLGAAGNLDTTNIQLNSSGELFIKATGGTATISFGDLTISGDPVVTLDASTIIVNGNLILESGSVLNTISPGSDTSGGCSIGSDSGVTVTSGDTTLVIDTMENCNTIGSGLQLDPSIIQVGVITPSPSITTGEITIIDPAVDPVNPVVGEPVPDTGEGDSSAAADSGSGALDMSVLLLMLICTGALRISHTNGRPDLSLTGL